MKRRALIQKTAGLGLLGGLWGGAGELLYASAQAPRAWQARQSNLPLRAKTGTQNSPSELPHWKSAAEGRCNWMTVYMKSRGRCVCRSRSAW